MYLPLGESAENIKVDRARARRPVFGRVLLASLGLALAAGILVPWHGARAAVNCGFGSAIAGGQCQGFITDTTQTTWTVPSDFTASNTIEAIGGSGEGADGAASNHGGGGGGGGAYAKVSNLNLTIGASISIKVGDGAPQAITPISGTSTWFNATTCSAASVCAAYGLPGVGQTGGGGGSAASSVGTVIFAGGKGGNGGGTATNGGGGGGAGGPNGAGNNGADQPASTGGSGDAGSGGGGGAINTTGGNGTEWDASHGSGGGGGGNAGLGGSYGGAPGGRTGGSGVGVSAQQGILVITYTPLPNLLQQDYIFENDSASSVGANTSPVSAGSARANIEKGERFVVRFLLTNTGGVSSTAFVVQMSHGSSGTDWKTVTSGGEIAYSYGISGTSVSQITSRKTAAACSGSSAFNNDGRWYENRANSDSYAFGASNCTELAWIFSTASSGPGTTYRLRLFNQTANKILDGSTATPTLTIVNPQTRDYSKTGTADGELFAAPTNSNDLTYYLDATGYSAVASDDGVYDTATAFQANSVPISLFKIKNPNGNSTDQATLTWNGQSNVSSQVDLEIWNGSSWENVQSNASPTVNTDFTLTGAKTGSAYYDSNFFIYLRVKQAAGAEALRTDLVSASFAAGGGGGGGGTSTSVGFQVSSRSDTLSDSRPSATSNHTFAFTVNTSITGSSTVTLTFNASFTLPGGLNCGDVDAATSSQFNFNYPGCAATATAWGFSVAGSTVTLQAPTDSTSTVHVATGTPVTIKIGSNATVGQQGAHWITNPSAAGIYTISVGGTFNGSGNMLVSINAGVTVQATVAESLAFTASSVNAVNCIADDGATVNSVTSTATSVPFGTISPNTFYQGCQDLTVSTNAGNGYSLTVQESSAMKTADGRFVIPDTTCDAGACSESAAAAWTTATHNGFGHTCFNQSNHDCNAAYSSGTLFRQAADISLGETAQSVMSSSTAATATGRMKFRLSPGSAQAAGIYTTIITYIITGTY